ncbi:MAG: DUF3536 domain-containing protein [Candidatus Margulisiibacteriota bacterium]|jgi:alpha-amylase/alpha-mannosidase (GH57 family)
MAKKFICIHGHFYQPPRENPWLEYLEVQDSAYPIHDWNERIFNECYGPNSAARILDNNADILKLVNNYEFLSFNFGPTLLSWLEEYHLDIYQKIIEADQKSLARLGHGNALAQVYNHVIMPLATYSYKVDQVEWGIRDFEKRFNRKPEGIWLGEAAVDLETLMVLEQYGLKFTILSPFQAAQFRELSKSDEKSMPKWIDAANGSIDPRRPYQINLPNGKHFTIFFYDARISKAIAFEELLASSENFLNGLKSGFANSPEEVGLVNIATDGESYGHHRKFGDLTLAFTFEELMESKEFEIVNYAYFLEKSPPRYEVKIHENSSWSCAHGVERWRSNCGCSTGAQPGWQQEWRKPLREALDLIRDVSDELYHEQIKNFTEFPNDIFYQYYDVFSTHEIEKKDAFFAACCKENLADLEKQEVLKLLEIRRNCNLMYTSCGWFFAEISGIETIQILNYADRVLQLLQGFDIDLKERFLDVLEKAPSNVPKYKNGKEIYQLFVAKNRVNLKRAGIHYAITSLFEDYLEVSKFYTYEVDCFDVTKEIRGLNTLAFGHILVKSTQTLESQSFQFVVLHYGEIDLHAAIEHYANKEEYQIKKNRMIEIFRNEHLTEMVQALTSDFGKEYFTLRDIFNEEKRSILSHVTKSEIDRLNQLIFYIAQKNKNILDYCFKEHIPVPKPIMILNEYTYQKIIEHLFSGSVPERDIYQQIQQVLTLVKALGFKLDLSNQVNQINKFLFDSLVKYFNEPASPNKLAEFILVLKSVSLLPVSINFWPIQNKWYDFFLNQESILLKDIKIKNSKIPELLAEVKTLLKLKVD